jgi:hypothetical protein
MWLEEEPTDREIARYVRFFLAYEAYTFFLTDNL